MRDILWGVLAMAALVAESASAQAPSAAHGALVVTPRMEAGRLVVELQNISKLPIRISGGVLAFAPAANAPAGAACTLDLPAQMVLQPVATEQFRGVEQSAIAGCLQRAGGTTVSPRLVAPFVLSDREAHRAEMRALVPQTARLEPASLRLTLQVGNQPEVASTHVLHLAVE